jgi:hypothetical protein
MAKIEKLLAIYTGAALNTPASNVLRLPSITGTITGVYFDASEVTDGDLELELFEDGVSVTALTVADTTANEDVTGLSFASTLGKVLSLSLLSPIPAGVPAPPWSLIVTVEVTETHVSLTGAQTVAGVKTFSSDPIIPDEAYGVGWNGSLEPPTKNAVYDKIETISAGSGDVATDAIFDAKGDLAVGTGANTAAKLTVGANDTIPLAASGETTGIKWATPTEIRTALALTIGTNVQAWDTLLDLIAALSDPGADKMLFWDESANAFAWLEPAANLSITGTDLDASGGGSSDFDDIITHNNEVVVHNGNVVALP